MEPSSAIRPPTPALFGWVLLVNTGVALGLWLAWPGRETFPAILLHSQLVGLAITAAALAIDHSGMFDRLARLAGLGLNLLLTAPIGYFVGTATALWIRTGEPPAFGWSNAWFGPLIATVAATAVVGLLIWAYERIHAEALAKVEAQRLAAEGELRLLRAQLEPHMLFNTLANLRELVDEQPATAREMIDSLIVFLRQTLASTRSRRTSLEAECALIGAYLSLMAIRMGDRLSWSVDLPAGLRGVQLPPMLLQPLVENAIQHGITPFVGQASIRVAAAAEAVDDVVITVADTGCGVDLARLNARTTSADEAQRGYGLSHVRERLHAEYRARSRLEIMANAPRGTLVELRIPRSFP